MQNKSKTIFLLALVTTSVYSLYYGGVVLYSPDAVMDFIAETNHLTIMYGYIPSNMTAKRIDVYNTSTNIATTIDNNLSIVYLHNASTKPSLPVYKIRFIIGINTQASYEYFISNSV